MSCATIAAGQETLVSNGIVYRVSNYEKSYRVDWVNADTASAGVRLESAAILQRCDDLIRAILAKASVDSSRILFGRDRIDSLRGGRSWIVYFQRHQGYRNLGGGVRLEVES